MVNGIWQFRPSHDRVDPRGMVTTYPLFDTPCLFSREPCHLRRLLQSWIPSDDAKPKPQTKKPYQILYLLDYLPVPNAQQMQLIDGFIADASRCLPAALTKLSIREAWKASHPTGTPDDVDEYLRNLVAETYYYEFYHSSDAFRENYADSHDGQPPYVIPFVQRRWAKGAAVTPPQNQDARRKLGVYRTWLHETLFAARETDALLVLPVANAAPSYRDAVSPSPENQSALDELFLQPILGAPHMVVPVGDVPYDSGVTGRVEYLPVVVDVVAAPGRDFELLDAVDEIMAQSGRPTVVATGSRMFPGL